MSGADFDLDRLLDDARADDRRAGPPAATLAVLKRRRHARTVLAGLAGVSLLLFGYAIGAAGGTAETPPTPPSPLLESTPDAVAPGPRELERRALAADDARLFRAAGQAYLEENGDLPASLRCFGRAVADDAEPPRSDDPWLLLALKTDRP